MREEKTLDEMVKEVHQICTLAKILFDVGPEELIERFRADVRFLIIEGSMDEESEVVARDMLGAVVQKHKRLRKSK